MTDFKFHIGDCVRSNNYAGLDQGADNLIIWARRPGPDVKRGSENQYDMIHENGSKDHSGWFEWGLELLENEYHLAVRYLGEDYFK